MKRLVVLAALLAAAGSLEAQTPAAAPRQLSLVEALDIAEGQSETVGIARQEVARAEGARRQARSARFPQLSGNASYQRTLRSQFSALQSDTTTGPAPEKCPSFSPRPGLTVDQRLDSLEAAVTCASNANPFAGLGGDLPFGRENTYRFGLSFSQSLFTGGRISGQSAAAGAGLRSASVGLTSARAQLLLDVTQAYYDAVLGDRLVTIAQATLEQADTTLSQTQLARDVGNQSEFDLLRARVTRDNQRPVVIQRQAARDLAYDRLRQMLNLPLSQPLALTTELGDTALVHPARLAELVENPADTSPEVRAPVRQANEAVRTQEALLQVARAQQWPQLTLSSDYAEFGYPGNVSPVGTNYLSDWAVTLGLTVPLFTGGRIRGDREVARANLEQARLRLQQTRELAQVDARSAQLQLASAEAAWQASSGTEEQATRAYQIAEIRYREGISTQTELNDLRIQQAQAQVNRAQAARDLQVARMRLALLPALPLAAQASAAATAATAPTSPSSGAAVQSTVPASQTPAARAGGVLTSTTVTGVPGQ
jgi:outer membrane protein TolC